MKDKAQWWFSAGAFALIGCSLSGAMPGEASKKPAPAAPIVGLEQSIGATAAYINNCAKCHGENAQGGGGGTASLLTEDKFDQKWDKPFFDAIKNGVKDAGMEAFGQTMKDETIWAMVVHIRELQKAGLRAQGMGPKQANGVYSAKDYKYKVEDVVTGGLSTPWAIDWLPDGRMLVTNIGGDFSLIKNGVATKIANTPQVKRMGQGGLMDVAVHPNYAKNGWIYLSYTDQGQKANEGFTTVVRGKLNFSGDQASWTNQEVIWKAAPEVYNPSGVHFGNRIVFDGKGHVFFSLGERGDGAKAQDLGRANGKVFRVMEDGSIPSDNPFVKNSTEKYLQAIWSYGHRNPQGLVLGLDGQLYDTEHGPRGGDELNRIQKGKNYGWPIAAFSINYNDAPLGIPWNKPGQDFTLPVFRWLPSIGACGLDVVDGGAFPKWKGDLVAGGLSGQNVDRIRIKNDQVVEREELIVGLGRVRDVMTGPDGNIYVALNQPDKIIRLVPVK